MLQFRSQLAFIEFNHYYWGYTSICTLDYTKSLISPCNLGVTVEFEIFSQYPQYTQQPPNLCLRYSWELIVSHWNWIAVNIAIVGYFFLNVEPCTYLKFTLNYSLEQSKAFSTFWHKTWVSIYWPICKNNLGLTLLRLHPGMCQLDQ